MRWMNAIHDEVVCRSCAKSCLPRQLLLGVSSKPTTTDSAVAMIGDEVSTTAISSYYGRLSRPEKTAEKTQ